MAKSLRTRFFLVFVVIGTTFAAALALSFSHARAAQELLWRNAVSERALTTADRLSSEVSQDLLVEEQLAADLTGSGQSLPAMLAHLTRVLSLHPGFQSFSLVSSDHVATVGAPPGSAAFIRSELAVRDVLAGASKSIEPVRSGSASTLHIAVLVKGPHGAREAVLGVASLPRREHPDGLMSLPVHWFVEASDGRLIDGDESSPGIGFARPKGDGTDPSGSPHVQKLSDPGGHGVWLVAFAPVPETDWRAGAALDHDEALDPLLLDERLTWLVFALVAALGLVAIWWLTGDVVQSIRRLRRAAQAVAGGDIGYRIRYVAGSEMDDLVEAFNNMAERLEAHQDLLHDRNQQLNVLLRVVEGLRTERDPQDLLRRITQDAAFVTTASVAFLAQVEDDQLRLKEWWDGARWIGQDLVWQPGQGAPGWVWLHHDNLTSDDYGVEQHSNTDNMAGVELRNYVCTPMVLPNGAVAGVLFVANKAGNAAFTDDDVRIMELLARHAGVALEVEAAFQRERRVAATLQKAMLPDVDPVVGGLSIAREYQAASEETELGGDFYDVIPLAGGRLGLVIADVSGKGLRAAVQTAAVKYALRAYALEDPDPSSVLERLNRACCSGPLSRGFVTLFFGVIDLVKLEMTYANAGHQPPLLRRANGVVESLASPGVVLGVVDSSLIAFQSQSVRLRGGDTLVLYTDGLSEARSGDDFLDTEGLQSLLGQMDLGAHETARYLLRAATAFAEGVLRDDVALLVVKVPVRSPSTTGADRRITSSTDR